MCRVMSVAISHTRKLNLRDTWKHTKRKEHMCVTNVAPATNTHLLFLGTLKINIELYKV